MFILQSKENNGDVIFLYCGSKLLVSRIKGHVVLPQDKSVSREHANLSITHDIENLGDCHKHPEIYLEDLGSKYGTYINEGINTTTKLKPFTLHQLQNGDTIRFGLLKNIWTICYKQIVACSSLVENLSDVKLAIKCLGGHLLKDWTSDCNLLLMNDLFLTAKAVCALSSCSNIVLPEYLINLVEAVQKKNTHPVPLSFRPPLKEICIGKENVSFVPDANRKTLFNKKKFIFSTIKSLKKLKCAVLLSGGTAEILSEENVHLLSKDDNILINQPDDSNKCNYLVNTAQEILQKNSLTALPESDIGLAIVHVSTINYCNPRFKVNDLLCRKKPAEIHPTQNFEIYATETQYNDLKAIRTAEISPATRTVITESGQSGKQTLSSRNPIAPSGSSPTKTVSNRMQTISNQLPSLPPFSLRDGYMGDTCMSTEIQALPVSPLKERRNSIKRERLPSNESHSPVNKKQNLGADKVPESRNMAANIHQNGISTELTQPFAPPYASSLLEDEELFQLDMDSDFIKNSDTKPPLLIEEPICDKSEQIDHFKTPEPRKRKQIGSSPILETQQKKAKSNDEPDRSHIPAGQTSDYNPFALPFTSSRRQRKVLPPMESQESLNDKSPEEETSVLIARVDSNVNSTPKQPSPIKLEETQPFIATRVKIEGNDNTKESTSVEVEKSLVVVEVVSLVKNSMNRLSLQDASTSTSFVGPNFKRFKKVSHGSCSGIMLVLPRIIGGQDLAISIDENPQKELFLASQQVEEQAPPTASVQNNHMMDNEFNLPITKRSRNRIR